MEHRVSQDSPWFKFWPEGVPGHLDYPEIPLFKFISSAAEEQPDAIAFNYHDDKLSYEELDNKTSRLAAGLCEQGIKKGDRVILCLPNCPEFVISYYGIMKVGATVVSTNPLYKAEELRHQINDAGASAVITDDNSFPKVKAIKDEVRLKAIVLAGAEGVEGTLSLREILEKYPPHPPRLNLKPKEDIAAIQYTGGTTGFPRGAMLTHYNLVANARQNATWFDWNCEDVIMGALPFYHSWGSCTCLNSPISSGARVVILPRFDAEELFRTIEQERATVLYGAASMFIMLANSPLIGKYDLSSLRYVKAGAMPIPPEVKVMWEQLTGVTMVLGYGLSEASPEALNSPPQRVKPGTVGIPVIDTDARIVDEETGKVELPPGKVGELTVRGPQVMKGYINQPDDDKGVLRNGWLYTGDLALMDEEGYFCIVDRKKDILKYKGYTIAPAEVESVLYEHPSVKECAVIGKPDTLVGEIPKACVVLKEGHTLSKEDLIKFCEERVAPYKKIREVEFLPEIPKTQVGKTLRRLLRDRERNPQADGGKTG